MDARNYRRRKAGGKPENVEAEPGKVAADTGKGGDEPEIVKAGIGKLLSRARKSRRRAR